MARALRIELAWGWHHVMSRGHRGGALFRSDAERRCFLGLVADLPERYRVEVHAFVLMDNHYHLLLRTPEANLSHAVRWLNLSYGIKFNWVHRAHGAVFQGRFRSVVIEDVPGVVEVARYLHLNPVRVDGLGLGKEDQRRARVLGCADPGRELVQRRLQRLAGYAWSSWRVYGGGEPKPDWLETGVIGKGCGGRTWAEQRKALREFTEEPIRQGRMESPWEQVVGGLVLGDPGFARRVLAGASVNAEEQTQARRLRPRVRWAEVVRAAEEVRGSRWSTWADVRGDWGRDAAMYVAVRHGGLRLAEVVKDVGGLKYQAAAQAVKRFGAALEADPERQRFVAALRRRLAIV